MFCSGCGTELEAGLNFCKRCGMRIGGDERSRVAENLSGALPYVGVFGFLGFIAVIFLLSRSPTVTPGLFALTAMLYLSTLFGICWLILQQTAPFTSKFEHRKQPAAEPQRLPYIQPATTARLGEPSQIPISVTEETTRTLDEVRVGRK
jgi:hypothetical protein